jgi:predicted permease
MTAWVQDLRYVFRALGKRPLYALTSIAVFALAIGANSTVFSVINGLFLRPLPYPDDSGLVIVYSSYPKMGLENAGTSVRDYLDRREQAPSLESLAMVANGSRTLQREGPPEQVSSARATPSLFGVLRIAPVLGRAFTESEAMPGNDRVAMLSYRTWTTRFGARPDAIGREMRLDGRAYRVIGVLPRGFNFFEREIDVWLPLAFSAEEASEARRGVTTGISVGRLRNGATLEGLDAELDAITRRYVENLSPQQAAFIDAAGFTGRAAPLRDVRVGDLEPMLLMLQAVVLAVLLIACANVANLQISRVAARRHELSVRTALGADRWRLARLVLAESLVLAAIGAGAGLALAAGGLDLVRVLGLDRSSEGFEFALDLNVLGFTAGVAVAAALLAGLLPMFALVRNDSIRSMSKTPRLGADGPGGGVAAQRFRNALVVVQLAAGVALLAGAGLLIEGFYRLERAGPGFDAANVWSASVMLPEARYSNPEARLRFYDEALEALRAIPGVTRAGLTSRLPFSGQNEGATIAIDGYAPVTQASPPVAQFRSISNEYFPSLGIRMIEGRGFDANETDRVVIVDEVMARKYWPNGALGQRVRSDSPADTSSMPTTAEPTASYTVVGVVPFVKHASMIEPQETPTVYWHYKQRPPKMAVFTLRAAVRPEQIGNAARVVIGRIDSEVALYDAMPMDVRIQRSLGPQRTPMVLTLVFAAIAFALAVVGLYGVLASTVTQRVAEIGVRLALGAPVTRVLRMILAEGARLVAVGLVLGTGGAILAGRLLSARIEYVSGLDAPVLAAAAIALAATAMLATWLPARRASRIDPMQALREE